MCEFWGGWGRTNSEWLWEPQCQWSNFTEAFRYSTLNISCSFNVTAKAQNLRYLFHFFLLNYSGKSWYRIYIWLECGYSIELKRMMQEGKKQNINSAVFCVLVFITDPLLWRPCWPVCPHSAQYHHWPSCRPGRKEGRYALITFQHILNDNGIAKKKSTSPFTQHETIQLLHTCALSRQRNKSVQMITC